MLIDDFFDRCVISVQLQWLITLSLLRVTETEFLLTKSSQKVVGIKKSIDKEIVSSSNTKFSKPIL